MNNQKILITGATGSFGKKMIDRIIKKYKFKDWLFFQEMN